MSVENNLKELKMEQLPLVHYGKAGGALNEYEEGLQTTLAMQKEGKSCT